MRRCYRWRCVAVTPDGRNTVESIHQRYGEAWTMLAISYNGHRDYAGKWEDIIPGCRPWGPAIGTGVEQGAKNGERTSGKRRESDWTRNRWEASTTSTVAQLAASAMSGGGGGTRVVQMTSFANSRVRQMALRSRSTRRYPAGTRRLS